MDKKNKTNVLRTKRMKDISRSSNEQFAALLSSKTQNPQLIKLQQQLTELRQQLTELRQQLQNFPEEIKQKIELQEKLRDLERITEIINNEREQLRRQNLQDNVINIILNTDNSLGEQQRLRDETSNLIKKLNLSPSSTSYEVLQMIPEEIQPVLMKIRGVQRQIIDVQKQILGASRRQV
jgi:predicted nuclease with TOPRIM domain